VRRHHRLGPISAPRLEVFFVGDDDVSCVWFDHRQPQRVGIEDLDGVISWLAASDLTLVMVTDALDEEMAELVEQAARG
jgi:hypothetical protein